MLTTVRESVEISEMSRGAQSLAPPSPYGEEPASCYGQGYAGQPLIGILPNRQLDLKRVQAEGTKPSHIGPIGPTQD